MYHLIENEDWITRISNALMFRPNRIEINSAQNHEPSKDEYVVHCYDEILKRLKKYYIKVDRTTGFDLQNNNALTYVAQQLRVAHIQPMYIEQQNGVVLWSNPVRHVRNAERTARYEC